MTEQEARVAIFGDSIVRYIADAAKHRGPISFIYKSGANAGDPSIASTFKRLLESFDIIVLCIGGNDISSGADGDDVVAILYKMYLDARAMGVQVFVCGITWRGSVRRITAKQFETALRRAYKQLRKILGEDLIDLHGRWGMNMYKKDLVHPSRRGARNAYRFIKHAVISRAKKMKLVLRC